MIQIRKSPSHNGRYNRNDRKKVLEHLQRSNMLTMTEVANQFNLSPSTIHHWVHRYLPKASANKIIKRGHLVRGKLCALAKKKTPSKNKTQDHLYDLQALLKEVTGKVEKLIKDYASE